MRQIPTVSGCPYLKGRPTWSDRKVSFLLACYAHFIPHVWDFHLLLKLQKEGTKPDPEAAEHGIKVPRVLPC